ALPALLVARPLPALIKATSGIIAAYLALWFWVAQEIRFLFPILPLASLVVAYALIAWAQQNTWARRVVIGVALVTAAANLVLLGSNFARPPGSVPPTKSLRVVFGVESRAEYLRRVLPNYRMVETINRLPSQSLILTFGLSDVYYLDRDFIRGFPVEQPLFDPITLADADAIAAQVRSLGVTHIVVNRNAENGITVLEHPAAPANFAVNMQTYIARDLILLNQVDGYDLYVVRR
ncbi:MAG: hypothetical protein L0Y55_20725, partial [Anaerolineales bacterium]|nr:hypothetical protein [Anaerolineales bacterium]